MVEIRMVNMSNVYWSVTGRGGGGRGCREGVIEERASEFRCPFEKKGV